MSTKQFAWEEFYAQWMNVSPKGLFFHDSGVIHHFRVKHKKEFSISDKNESICVSRQIHEKETRACIEKIFEYRKAKVCKMFYKKNKFY